MLSIFKDARFFPVEEVCGAALIRRTRLNIDNCDALICPPAYRRIRFQRVMCLFLKSTFGSLLIPPLQQGAPVSKAQWNEHTQCKNEQIVQEEERSHPSERIIDYPKNEGDDQDNQGE